MGIFLVCYRAPSIFTLGGFPFANHYYILNQKPYIKAEWFALPKAHILLKQEPNNYLNLLSILSATWNYVSHSFIDSFITSNSMDFIFLSLCFETGLRWRSLLSCCCWSYHFHPQRWLAIGIISLMETSFLIITATSVVRISNVRKVSAEDP